MKLIRSAFTDQGIFGELFDDHGNKIASTLEHAYLMEHTWYPKLPEGTYTCKRGMHRLASMTDDFETFEILGVPNHTGILIHWGNFNRDSSGCVLVGLSRMGNMITDSRRAFAIFLKLLEGVDTFQLTVENSV